MAQFAEVLIDGVPATMFRISYVGENGWEVYTKWSMAFVCGTQLPKLAKIRHHPGWYGVYAVTGRIEKGYRLMGAELESEYNPVEAGLNRPKLSRLTSSARRHT